MRSGGGSEAPITLGHSPDPDDAFMHHAIARGRIDTGGLRFEHVVEDIESLNRRALAGEIDETAISFHAYAFVADRYRLLRCGGAFGEGYGPVVVATRPLRVEDLPKVRVAVPGERTTAALALRLAAGPCETVAVPFDRIVEALRRGEADAGVLIHEGQITFAEEGLSKVLDLGAWWREETGLPLPLGGNAVRRDLGDLGERIGDVLARSIRHALDHRAEALEYALGFARGLAREKADRFVGMYVNEATVDFGDRGLRAIRALYERAAAEGLLPAVDVDAIASAR